jgi:acyl-CoA synthetase (AMP-forming)/AMP-acid ligase II
VLLPNSPEFLAAFFAAQALGAAAVPLPWPVVDGAPDRVRESLDSVLRRAELTVLVTTPSMTTVDWGVPVVTAPAQPLEGNPRPTGLDGTAFIQFTSGSTGDPRGAVISQRAALSSAHAMGTALGLGPADVGVSWLPFFHDMGLVGVLLTSLLARFPVHVLRPGDFLMRPKKWLDLVSSQRATLTVGPNFAWELVTRRVSTDGLDLSNLRCALNGSEPIHRSTLDGFATKFAAAGFDPKAMLPVYGLAEATLGVSFARRGDARPDEKVDGREVPCCGTLVPGLELAVMSGEGQVLGEGVQGELCVRGPMVMDGYFHHPEATAVALPDGKSGWLHTGDLGVVRDGAVFITGREKELVIQQGRKFHPYDIERVVTAMVDATPNGVAAVSRPDPAQGSEALVVIVELRRVSGAIDPMLIRGELLKTLGVRADVVELVPAGTLPRTTSGKVKRRELSLRSPQVIA